MPQVKIDDLEGMVNNLANRLQDNFGSITLIGTNHNSGWPDTSQEQNTKLELRLHKLNTLLERSFSLITDTNNHYCELIDFGYNTDSFNDLHIGIALLKQRICDFQRSVNEALFKQLGNPKNDILNIVEFLLKAGADLNCKSTKGTALERAWDLTRADEILPIMLKYGNKTIVNQRFTDNSRPVTRALEEDRIELLEQLLKHGAEVIPIGVLDTQICYKPTLLHQAAAAGNLKAVELLISYGADPNAAIQTPNSNKFVNLVSSSLCGRARGRTPLHEAIQFIVNNPRKMVDGLNVITSLITAGAKTNIADNEGLAAHTRANNIKDQSLKSNIQIALSTTSSYNVSKIQNREFKEITYLIRRQNGNNNQEVLSR